MSNAAEIETEPGQQLVVSPVESTETTSTEIVSAQPGEALLAEAELMVQDRRWRKALKLLEAARSIGSQSPRLNELMAVAANHAGSRSLRREALEDLREREVQTTSSALALARIALTNRQFAASDIMARQALAADPYSAPAWHHLAASFCALGWFEEADKCIASAGSEPEHPTDRFYLGRAINTWAMSHTQTMLVTIIAVLLFGVLGLAVGLAVPMVTRELRVANLPERFRDLASEEWKTQHGFRLFYAGSVLLVVLLALVVGTPGG